MVPSKIKKTHFSSTQANHVGLNTKCHIGVIVLSSASFQVLYVVQFLVRRVAY